MDNGAGKALSLHAISICFFFSYLIASLIFYPSILLNGRIWAEEAREFLIPLASTGRAVNALLYIHKSHLDLAPNIATFLSLVFPIEYAPNIFVWVSIIPVAIFSVCLGYVISRSTRLALFSKSSLFFLLWICAIGALGGGSYIAVESHLNTINSWSYVVASVGLLIPFRPSRTGLSIDSVFVGISPLLAFPCVLFAPWLMLQFVLTRCRRIKARNLCFFLSCAAQIALASLLPSSWSFGGGRCLTFRDLISIVPTMLIKNISPLFGNVDAFRPFAGSFLGMHESLLCISFLSVALLIVMVHSYTKAYRVSSIARAFFSDPGSPSSLAISLFFPILSWQLFAVPLGLAGAYAQLMIGGGNRYSNSMFLVFAAIASILFAFVSDSRCFCVTTSGREFCCRVDKLISAKSLVIRGLLLTWLAVMITGSVHKQFLMHSAGVDDFWCFESRPEWRYRDRAEFEDALRHPSSIITCPRGWSNEMQGRKAKSKEERAQFCNRKFE